MTSAQTHDPAILNFAASKESLLDHIQWHKKVIIDEDCPWNLQMRLHEKPSMHGEILGE